MGVAVIGHDARPNPDQTDAGRTDDVARGRRAGVRGSIRSMRSGNWQARLPKDLDPWTRPLGQTFPTYEDAVVQLRRYISDIEGGRIRLEDPTLEPAPNLAPEKAPVLVTVREVLENFLVEHIDLAANTVGGYQSLIKHVICHPEHGIGDARVAGLTGGNLTQWRRSLTAVGFTDSNAKGGWRVLRSALSWEVESGRLANNPALGLTTRRTKSRRAAANTDAVRLPTWQHIHQLAAAIPHAEQRLMFLMLAWGGMRVSELLAIEPDGLLPATHEVQLAQVWVKPKAQPWIREPLKGGLARRVPLPAGLWTHLQTHATAWTEPTGIGRVHVLFRPQVTYRRGPGIWTSTSWRDDVMLPAAKTTGLPYRTKDMRAYAASALVDIGATQAEAQRLLGHASGDTTQKHYIRALDAKAHDPGRAALRMDATLTPIERLDALWDAWVTQFGDPFADNP